jgi:hypothetical protein
MLCTLMTNRGQKIKYLSERMHKDTYRSPEEGEKNLVDFRWFVGDWWAVVQSFEDLGYSSDQSRSKLSMRDRHTNLGPYLHSWLLSVFRRLKYRVLAVQVRVTLGALFGFNNAQALAPLLYSPNLNIRHGAGPPSFQNK